MSGSIARAYDAAWFVSFYRDRSSTASSSHGTVPLGWTHALSATEGIRSRAPEEAVDAFFEAFNRGHLEAIVALYEQKATLVAQPGQIAEGHAAIREALNGFLATNPTLNPEEKALITGGDIALSVIRWTLSGTGPDAAPVRMDGTTSDVLRRQADGRWPFVIDDPWGAGVLS